MPPPRPTPTAPAGTRRSQGESSAPHPAPGTAARRSGRFCRRRSAPRGPAPPCRPAWGSPRPSPVAGSSFPTTADSRACTGSLVGPLRTAGSTARPPRPRPGWPSPSDTPPRPPIWRSETACPAASARSPGSSQPCWLTAKPARATRPLRSTRVTGLPRYYEAVRPPAPHRYAAPRSFRCLGVSLSPTTPTRGQPYRGEEFPRSAPAPEPGSRHLCAGHHLANQQAPARLIPGQQLDPGFDVVATLSTLHQWFTRVRLPGSHLTHRMRLFRNAHHPGSFTGAACGGLGPPPAERSRRTNLHHQHSTASKKVRLLHQTLPPRSWHTVVGVPDQHPELAAPPRPFRIQHMERDVAQQGADR